MTDPAALRDALIARIAEAADLAALEALRVEALGKQGSITGLLKSLGGMAPEERQTAGPAIQAAREAVTEALADRRALFEARELEARLATEQLDLSLPVDAAAPGSIHPVSQVM